MLFDDKMDDYIFNFNPSLKPEKDIRGINSNIYSNPNVSRAKRDSLRKAYVKTLNEIFIIKIDSINYESEFILGECLKNQKGFETYVGIKGLPEGKYLLEVLRKRLIKKDTSKINYTRIPFWYYPN